MKEDSELVVKSKNRNEFSKLIYVKRDGWVVTESGAMGDNQEDCEVIWSGQIDYLKKIRKSKKLTQQEMAWILGLNRTTYINLESGKRELTHKEYLITQVIEYITL